MLAALCACSVAACGPLQPTGSWPELGRRLTTGKPVAVTDTAGAEVRGRVSSIAAASLTLNVAGASRQFDAADVRQVRRDGDPLWNGLAWGAGFGAAGALLSDPRCSGPSTCHADIPQRLAFVAAMAAAGIGLDALHRDRTILYRSPGRRAFSVAPFVSPRGALSIAVRVR